MYDTSRHIIYDPFKISIIRSIVKSSISFISKFPWNVLWSFSDRIEKIPVDNAQVNKAIFHGSIDLNSPEFIPVRKIFSKNFKIVFDCFILELCSSPETFFRTKLPVLEKKHYFEILIVLYEKLVINISSFPQFCLCIHVGSNGIFHHI